MDAEHGVEKVIVRQLAVEREIAQAILLRFGDCSEPGDSQITIGTCVCSRGAIKYGIA